MNSYPEPDVVRGDLGDEFLKAFVASVDGSRTDLTEFHQFRPDWYADYSKRFVANFIHERVWSRMVPDGPGWSRVSRTTLGSPS